jgi:hypothetical protein
MKAGVNKNGEESSKRGEREKHTKNSEFKVRHSHWARYIAFAVLLSLKYSPRCPKVGR